MNLLSLFIGNKKYSAVVCLLFVIAFSSCSVKAPQRPLQYKFSAEELRYDFTELRKSLEANHPSLYWYTSKDSMDYFFDAAYNSITDSMTELQFKNKVAEVVGKIRCGHTSVRFSKSFTTALANEKGPTFPLAIKTWKDSMVVLNSIYRADTVFKRGTIIKSINNRTNKQILDSLFLFMSTDGYSDNFKSQVVTFNFGYYYKNVFGLDSQYHIVYIDSSGKEQSATIKNYFPRKDTTPRTATGIEVYSKPTRREIREAKLLSKHSLLIDTANSIGYMRLTTFSRGQQKRFYRKSFKKLNKLHIKNLVVDVRENGGGRFSNSIKITKYLIDHPWKTADTIAAVGRIPYSKYVTPSFGFKLAMLFTARKMEDGKIHINRFERHYFKPYTNKRHFDGKVYIIQGGYTFSAATMFVQALKGQKNITLIGEETGGGNYGNSAVHLPQIKLPNTNMRIVLPLYRMVFNANAIKDGRGVMPDIYIPPSAEAIQKGIDIKMQKVRELIFR